MSIYDQEMRLDTEADETIYAKLRISYIQALACALACGKDWMLIYHTKSYVSLPVGVDLRWDAMARESFGQAIDWGLAAVIEQDIGPDLKETWEDGGTIMWADSVSQTQDEISTDLVDISYIELNQEEQAWYNTLLDFTETRVNLGLAVFPESDGSEAAQEVWSVQMCNLSEGYKFLVYAPVAGTQEQFHLGIPTVLRDDAYGWMSRLRLLREEKSSTPLPHRSSLSRKSRLAGISSLPHEPRTRVTIVGDGP